jgi:transposase-like protein
LSSKLTVDENSKHRPVQYLNNILEQDHRAIKTPGARKPTFSFILGSSAYDRRRQIGHVGAARTDA